MAKLWGFSEGFDMNRLNPVLDGNLEPYPEEEAPASEDDEFATLIDEVENMG
ncbi:UNVERIFIED_CONTAM: hypothetical protein Slati_2641300 [Sesamum latifolium]|uniref:Uncharacterized protein n=1 Tax=Sesamum latifolium TaxID=2727402 RepID=A0AAW2VW00_9LAMI